MLYLLDANVLISAHEDYYGIDQVPQFWVAGQVKMPYKIHQEIAISEGPLSSWITVATTKKALVLDEEVDQDLVERVLNEGYGTNLNDGELEKIGQDPFLAAYALAVVHRR